MGTSIERSFWHASQARQLAFCACLRSQCGTVYFGYGRQHLPPCYVKQATGVLRYFDTFRHTHKLHGLMASLTGAFWSRAQILTNKYASPQSRLRFWRCISFSICDFHLAGLHPCKSTADTLGRHINKLIWKLMQFRPNADESPSEFCTRKNRETAAAKKITKFCIRRRLAERVVSWTEHIHRHPESMS